VKKSNLFIIGAPKCGTTSMAVYLSKHPKIFLSPFKEPHYFNTDSDYRFTFSQSQYHKNFESANKEHKYIMDASVWYLYSKRAVKEIIQYNPAAKFIVMLRNPIDMFYSLHQQLLFSGIENIKSPLNAWNLQELRRNGNNIPYACRDKSFLQYKDVCSLGAQVEILLNSIPREKIHFVLIDDLKIDVENSYFAVLNFLNLTNQSLLKYKIINSKKEKLIPWVSNIFSFINSIKRKLNITKGLGIANLIAKINRKDASDIYKQDFEMMKPFLLKEFHDDVLLLESLINRDLSGWIKQPEIKKT
jgi:hypothetical protein